MPDTPQPDPTEQELRLLVLLASGQRLDDLTAAVTRLYGAEGSIERLFPPAEASGDMERMYLVRVARIGRDVSPWDEAYRLRDAGRFENVQPDRIDVLEPQTGVADLAGLDCFSNPGIPAPTDHDWALKEVNAKDAWDLEPKPGGRRFGEGIRVCHPDTGWAKHDDLDRDRLDRVNSANILEGGNNAEDPLDYDFPLASRGHGTATGSVIMSGFAGDMKGVAPAATLVPIRTARSVVRVWDSLLARAVAHASRVGCDVISISLGGAGFFGLKAAIDEAVRGGAIVVTAAGNCVNLVIAPALYDRTIAVGATNADHKPWHGSCHGAAVDVSAPGEDIYRALRDHPSDSITTVKESDGTSYATAMVAGAAALWLAHNGRQAVLTARRPGETIHDVFTRVVKATANHSFPGWDPNEFGSGILDLRALLDARLDVGDSPDPTALEPAATDDDVSLLARALGRDTASTRSALRASLKPGQDLDRFAAELLEIAYRDPASVDAILDTGNADLAVPGAPSVRNRASSRLNRALR